MKGISVVGVDLAKNVFQLHGVDERGQVVLRRQIKRGKLLETMAQLPRCLVGMEACSSAHYWAREIGALGYEVRLMAPKFVKPYLKSQKNDGNDAQAICEAVSRPNMRFVGVKSTAQQDLQCVHRVRSRLMKARTALINELRGLLGEYGLVVPRTPQQVKKLVPTFLEQGCRVLSQPIRALFAEVLEELRWLEERIGLMDERIEREAKGNPLCQRLQQVEGVGPLTATALVAAVGDPRAFKNGRQFAAWLGLVPRQNSSRSTTRLGRITVNRPPAPRV